jgi:hypothetical protein
MQRLRTHGDEQLSADRAACDYAARPTFATLSPAQRAFELIARLDIARQHADRAAFDAAKAELATLVEEL